MSAERDYLAHALLSSGASVRAHPLPPAALGGWSHLYRAIVGAIRGRKQVLRRVGFPVLPRAFYDRLEPKEAAQAREVAEHALRRGLVLPPVELCAQALLDAHHQRKAERALHERFARDLAALRGTDAGHRRSADGAMSRSRLPAEAAGGVSGTKKPNTTATARGRESTGRVRHGPGAARETG